MLPVPRTRPAAPRKISVARRIRRDAGAALEYLWELSGSVRLYKADALLVEGIERSTGRPITSFYLGHFDNFAFVFGRMYSDFRVVEKRKGVNSLWVRRWIEQCGEGAELLFLDVELLFCKLVPEHEFIQIPQWVRQKYDVPDTWEGVLGSFRKNTKRTDLRKVRKFGLSYRLIKSEDEFRNFYHHMYVPYLRSRFGDEALIESQRKVMHQCRKGELLQILRGDSVVAAAAIHVLGNRLAWVWVGQPDGIEEELSRGAFSAMYYYTILHAFECGCRRVDFFGSRPLLNDGLFRFKRKWGTFMEDSPVPRGDILLKPLSMTEGIQGFFRANPFIVRRGDGLVGQLLVDGMATSSEELEHLYLQLYTEGLQSMRFFSISGFPPEAKSWADGVDGMALELCDLSGSADPAAAFCSA